MYSITKHVSGSNPRAAARSWMVLQLLLGGGLWASLVPGAFADEPVRAAPVVIAEYVRAGLDANLSLANQTLEFQKSVAALDAARARFYPDLSFNARYTRASGGRQIDLPLGQLLNPAYQTLNELLAASGGAARFPVVGDESIPLQLPREQDTRISLRQPLYAPAIPAAVDAARAASQATDYAHQAFARALRRDITVAYLDWLRARNAAQIIAASVALLAENLRVNTSQYENGKITRDAVLRAQTEWLTVQQQQHDADNATLQARSYVNFLVNRPLESPLEAAAIDSSLIAPTTLPPLETATHDALATRPELQQLQQAQQAAEAQVRVARAARKPTLAFGIDAGTQGSDYGIGHNYNFVTASLVVNWTLFDAGARAASESQARLARRQLDNDQQLSSAHIELEVRQAHDSLRSAIDSLVTAQARAAAAQAGFTLASRRRDAGLASQLEFLDARNALTSAELNENLTRCAWLQRQAEYDFARGATP